MLALTAIDNQDDLTYLARSNGVGQVDISSIYTREGLVENVKKLAVEEPVEILATEETAEWLGGELDMYARVHFLSRVEAIYKFFEDRLDKRTPVIVVSLGLDSACLGLFQNGQLKSSPRVSPDLGLKLIWQDIVASSVVLQRTIADRKRSNPRAEDDLFSDFRRNFPGNEADYASVQLRSTLGHINKAIENLADIGEEKHYLVLSNWGACGSLPTLLRQEQFLVVFSEAPFLDALYGLLRWAADKDFSEEIVIECRACRKKNRVAPHPSDKRPVCGVCAHPLPPLSFQEGMDALQRGDYATAIQHFERLLGEDNTTKEFQALALLANVKHYKSIEGYENKIEEVRGWTELEKSEKPWVKEVLTLAGKEYLGKGDIESAEKNLAAVYQIEPSGEVAVLLGRVKQAKGDQALRRGNPKAAHALYKEAIANDGSNEDYPRYLAQITKVLEAQKATNRKIAWGFLGAIVISLIVGAWFGNGGDPDITRLKAQVKELNRNNQKLQQDLATQKQDFETHLSGKDSEIERLKEQVAGQRGGGQLAPVEQGGRVSTESELSALRGTNASLREKIGTLEGELRRRDEAARTLRLGRYRVIRETSLLSAPDKNASVVNHLSRGIIIRVVEIVDGTWLRIISTMGNDPGYLHRDDAVLLSPESSGP